MEQKTTEFWTIFSDSLRRFILNKVKTDTLADDLLQETFIKIHSKSVWLVHFLFIVWFAVLWNTVLFFGLISMFGH